MVFGTSSELREFSHGKSIDFIIQTATEVINYVKSKGVEVRFSSEVSLRISTALCIHPLNMALDCECRIV